MANGRFMYWNGMNTAPDLSEEEFQKFNDFYTNVHIREVVAMNPAPAAPAASVATAGQSRLASGSSRAGSGARPTTARSTSAAPPPATSAPTARNRAAAAPRTWLFMDRP